MSEEKKQAQYQVNISESALNEFRAILAEPGNEGKAIRVIFRGFG